MPLQLRPLLRELTIQTKGLTTERFPIDAPFAWAQREFVDAVESQYNQRQPVRIIVLKARQLGISTATEGIIFNWSFVHPGTNGLVIAHENEASSGLFEKTKMYWDTWPFRPYYTLKYATRRELSWVETRSHIKVATAKNVASGRGSTLHAVHASECAFYADPEALMVGLNQTIPNKHGTIVVLESTANGVGNWFHKTWQSAEHGESEYLPLFFPWYRHPEYAQPTTLNVRSELDPDERELLRVGASYENIAWRRWAIVNRASGDLDFFMQEYPSTPEEAFITTGRPIFSYSCLRECYDKERGFRGVLHDLQSGNVKFVNDRSGNLVIYKAPRPDDPRTDRYFVAGDPSYSVEGDPACIQVINRKTMEQVAVWHGRCDPMSLGDEMIRIGKFYNYATLCPEVEGGGQATIATIINRGYPNIWMHRNPDRVAKGFNAFGWSTNWQRKSWAIGTLSRMVIDKSLRIHDQVTYDQLRDYVVRPNGDWGNSDPDIHDDSVMALAIAVTASRAEGPFVENYVENSPIHDIIDQEWDDRDFGT
jgi:hypothetical protein